MRQLAFIAALALFMLPISALTINVSTTLTSDQGNILLNASGITLDCDNHYTAYISSNFGGNTIKNCWQLRGYNCLGAAGMDVVGDNNVIENNHFGLAPPNGVECCNFAVNLAQGSNNKIINNSFSTANWVGCQAFTYITPTRQTNLLINSTVWGYGGNSFTQTLSNCNNCTIDNSGSLRYHIFNSTGVTIQNRALPYTFDTTNSTNIIYTDLSFPAGTPAILSNVHNVWLINIGSGWGLNVLNSTSINTRNYSGTLTLSEVDGYLMDTGVPTTLSMTDTQNVQSLLGVVTNFTSLTLIRDSGINIGGYIGTLTLVNSSAVQTTGPVNAISLDGAIQCNFNGIATSNTSLMLNTVDIIRSQGINIKDYTANAFGSATAQTVSCPFIAPHGAWVRSIQMQVRNGSSGITFDNMTFAGNWGPGLPPSGANLVTYWLLYVNTGVTDVTLKNSIINTSINLVYDANMPSVTTLENNGYAQTMRGAKNITGFIVGRISPLLYIGIDGSDYPYNQNTSNNTAIGATQDSCGATAIPAYELRNVVDNSPLTWRSFSNGTLNVTIESPPNNAYLGAVSTVTIYYKINAGAGLRNCQLLMQADGYAGYDVQKTIPCGTGAGESLSTSATVSMGGGYTITVIALDNSGAALDSVHVSFYTDPGNGSGGCVGPACWACSVLHPENCWAPCVGPSCNSSNYTYYDLCVAGRTQYGTNQSYIERYITCNFGRLLGNSEFGGMMLAIVVGLFFLVFVMLQNTRLDGKIAILIPAVLLISVWMGWIMYVMGFVLGIIIFFAISRIFLR